MSKVSTFINVWPEDLRYEPSHSWRTGIPCAGCDAEVVTEAGTGPLPRLCAACEEEFTRERERVKKARQRARKRGVAEEDLPDLPVLPELIEPVDDGSWLPSTYLEAAELGLAMRVDRDPDDEPVSVNVSEHRPTYVNPLGLRPRGLWDGDGHFISGVETRRPLGMETPDVDALTRDHLWLARREIDSLAARGRNALARLWERRQSDLRWEYVDLMYDIAEQEGVAPQHTYEHGRRLRWDHAAEARQRMAKRVMTESMTDEHLRDERPKVRLRDTMRYAEADSRRLSGEVTVSPVTEAAAWWVDADGKALKPPKEWQQFWFDHGFIPASE